MHYDQQRQARFLNSLGMGIKSAGDMIIAMVVLVMVVLAGYWLISWYRERPPRPAEYEIIINRVLKRLARLGITRKPSEDLSSLHRRVAGQTGLHQKNLQEIFSVYNRIKYARGFHGDSVMRRFRKMVSEWEAMTSGASKARRQKV